MDHFRILMITVFGKDFSAAKNREISSYFRPLVGYILLWTSGFCVIEPEKGSEITGGGKQKAGSPSTPVEQY